MQIINKVFIITLFNTIIFGQFLKQNSKNLFYEFLLLHLSLIIPFIIH